MRSLASGTDDFNDPSGTLRSSVVAGSGTKALKYSA